MSTPIPIWSAGNPREVVLRLALRLPEPCRDGQIRCCASGPYHLYLGGTRLGGGAGGVLLDTPMQETVPLEGSWNSGEIELIVVAQGGATDTPWFLCDGTLQVVGHEDQTVAITSGVDWQACPRPQDSMGKPTSFERHMAMDAPIGLGGWEGVSVVDGPPSPRDLVGSAESAQSPTVVVHVGARSSDADLATITIPQSLGSCKCVHHDALLGGGHGTTQVRTRPGDTVQIQFDLGRQISGWPLLRLRGGRGGVVDLRLSSRPDTSEHHIRYHCGDGRQEMAGLRLITARYVTMSLTGFDDEDTAIEALHMIERAVEETAVGQLQIDDQFDAAWLIGQASVHNSRQESYGSRLLPDRYDWLAGWVLQSNDLAHTSSPRIARQTLLGRAPIAPFEPGDFAYALAVLGYYQHAGDEATTDAALGVLARLWSQADDVLDRPTTRWGQAAAAALALAAIDATCQIGEYRQRTLELDAIRAKCLEVLTACWDETTELYADDPKGDRFQQWTNGLVLLARGDKDGRAAQIEQSMRRPGVEPISTFTQAWVVAAGLGRAGRVQRMMDVISNHWLRRLSREGRTWRDKGAFDPSATAPGPDALWVRHLLGVRSLGPAWSIREVTPPLAVLPQAQARVPLCEGASLSLSWGPDIDEDAPDPEVSRADNLRPNPVRLNLGVDLEGETHLRLERGGRKRPTVSVNGEVVWRNEKIYPNPIVHLIAAEEDHVLLLLDRTGHFQIHLE
ncbi:MAG: hypothetical protein VX255_11765 [Candidatus Latescibacterota bacterium]|nr:hypothetical protein [Candidatus Latescibacterota bacterium]